MSFSFKIVYVLASPRPLFPQLPTHRQQEAQKTETTIFWNVWVIPASGVWLVWSVLAFIAPSLRLT